MRIILYYYYYYYYYYTFERISKFEYKKKTETV